jgi:hypothetical protein
VVASAILPITILSFAQASQEDVAKYADPNVRVTQLMEWRGRVIVSSMNVLPNNELLAITLAEQDDLAGLGVKFTGKVAVISRISKDHGRTWGAAFLILDSPTDGSRTATDPTTVVAGGKVIVIVSMSGPPQPPFEWGDLELWQVTSADNAATWSKPAEIQVPRVRPAVSGRPGVALGHGTILVPYWWDFTFQTGANSMAQIGDIPCVSGTIISEDGGATWNLSTNVYDQLYLAKLSSSSSCSFTCRHGAIKLSRSWTIRLRTSSRLIRPKSTTSIKPPSN